jgi:hypothetical protein
VTLLRTHDTPPVVRTVKFPEATFSPTPQLGWTVEVGQERLRDRRDALRLRAVEDVIALAPFTGTTVWTARLAPGTYRFGSDPARLAQTLRVTKRRLSVARRDALAALRLHALDPQPFTAGAREEVDADSEAEPQDTRADE